MNEKELAEIEARADAATPGPWIGDRNDGTIKYKMMGGLDGQTEVLVVDHKNGDSGFYCGDGTGYAECEANEEFVKHSRQDIPALVAEVRRLNHELAQMKVIDAAIERDNSDIRKENAKLRTIIGEAIEWYECGEMNRLEQALKGGEG